MEIDDKQELNFRSIANTIADLGYTGFVALEWRPAMGNDPVKSLDPRAGTEKRKHSRAARRHLLISTSAWSVSVAKLPI